MTTLTYNLDLFDASLIVSALSCGLVTGFIFTYAILICDGYYQYFNGENILGFKLSGVRVSSFFGDELIMGSYLSRLFPLLFALFLDSYLRVDLLLC